MRRVVVRRAALVACAVAAPVAAALSPEHARATASQAWPAFVLVASLLAIGAIAAQDELFTSLGSLAARAPGRGTALLLSSLGAVAVVTVFLNLDTAVVFLTPVVVHAARTRGLDDAPFLYGTVFMANAASLLLPGSNLTNLIVLSREHVAGALFAARMAPSWIAAVAVTALFVLVVFRRQLRCVAVQKNPGAKLVFGVGVAGTVAAAALIVVLAQPALPVLLVAFAAAALQIARRTLTLKKAVAASGASFLVPLFGVVIALGTLARSTHALGSLVTSTGRWTTAGIGALAAVAVNNLPAATVLSAHAPAHPRALLLGLDIGPNLAVTGSLSAFLWLRVARGLGCRASVVRYSKLGILLTPISLAAALAALLIVAPRGF